MGPARGHALRPAALHAELCAAWSERIGEGADAGEARLVALRDALEREVLRRPSAHAERALLRDVRMWICVALRDTPHDEEAGAYAVDRALDLLAVATHARRRTRR